MKALRPGQVQLFDATRGLASLFLRHFCKDHLKQRRKDGWSMRKSFTAAEGTDRAKCLDCGGEKKETSDAVA